jgi:protein-L-isoaspartate(D-aspartate) O-methyltransferase
MTVEARKIRLIMQLRRSGISDTSVLSAIERIPREAFVPDSFLDQAYEDRSLPIGRGQTLSQPRVVALMTQALRTDRRIKVLEVGTGSGYQAAVLSRLCRRLYTIERHRELQRAAERRFQKLRLHNITARLGDGAKGWPEQAPFARIIVTAAAEQIPAGLVDQLAPGGIMIVPVGDRGRDQELLRVTRTADGIHEEVLGGVRFVPLVEGVPPDGAPESVAAREAGLRPSTLA